MQKKKYTHERDRAMRITQRESAANRKSFKFLIRRKVERKEEEEQGTWSFERKTTHFEATIQSPQDLQDSPSRNSQQAPNYHSSNRFLLNLPRIDSPENCAREISFEEREKKFCDCRSRATFSHETKFEKEPVIATTATDFHFRIAAVTLNPLALDCPS